MAIHPSNKEKFPVEDPTKVPQPPWKPSFNSQPYKQLWENIKSKWPPEAKAFINEIETNERKHESIRDWIREFGNVVSVTLELVPLTREFLIMTPRYLDYCRRIPENMMQRINQNFNLNLEFQEFVTGDDTTRYERYASMPGETAPPSYMFDGKIKWGLGRFLAALIRGDLYLRVWHIRTDPNLCDSIMAQIAAIDKLNVYVSAKSPYSPFSMPFKPPVPPEVIRTGPPPIYGWLTTGSPGGGFASPPPWVPKTVAKRYESMWKAADNADLLGRSPELELDENGEPDAESLVDADFNRSESDFDEAGGFTVVFATDPTGKDLTDLTGIDRFTIDKPIPFTIGSTRFWIYGGVSGV